MVPGLVGAAIIMGNVRRIDADVLDQQGHLKVMPASYYAGTTRGERAAFGVKHAAYCLPTKELIAWLKTRIGGRRAIEIGAGNGVLAHALDIEATDNFMQEDPEVRAFYAAAGQPTIKYGTNVTKIDAMSCIETARPEVVVAAWVTQLYDPSRHELGGNMFGVDEREILKHCDEYIFIGNEKVHGGKPIWELPHEIIKPDWLYSRAINGSPEFIAVWRGERST